MGSNPFNCICENRKCGYTCVVILLILGLGSIIQLFFVPASVENAFYDGINDRIVMTQDQQDQQTEDYRNWQNNYYEDAPLQLFEFWIYNVTNPYDVPNGQFPTFDMIGPFTFRRYENRSGPGNMTEPLFIEDEDESIVMYEYEYHFEYLPEQSVPGIDLDDYVWTISGAMMGYFATVTATADNRSFPLACVDTALAAYPGHSVFYHTPIRNLTTGIRDPWIARLDEYCREDPFWALLKPETLYALLADGNNGVIQHTGKQNITKVGELIEYRNWSIPQTNTFKALNAGVLWLDHNETVEGSRETRNFPPENWITKDRELTVWSIEKFRQTQYVYDKEVQYEGVDLLRFRIKDDELLKCEYFYNNSCSQNPSLSPTNAPTMEPTFDGTMSPSTSPTTPSPTCEYEIGESHTCKYYQFGEDGIANLSNLRGSPSFMSKGRFLDAPYYINDTNIAFGLEVPERDENDQYFDVDPRSGIVFRNYHNYQINFEFLPLNRPYPTNYTNFSIVGKMIPFALVRVEALATKDQMDFYKGTLDAIDVISGVSLYGGPILAVIFFALMFFILCKMKQHGLRDQMKQSNQFSKLVDEQTGDVSMDKYQNSTTSMYGTSTTGTRNKI